MKKHTITREIRTADDEAHCYDALLDVKRRCPGYLFEDIPLCVFFADDEGRFTTLGIDSDGPIRCAACIDATKGES